MSALPAIHIRPAAEGDCSDLVHFIRELAAYEKLEQEVRIDARTLRASLFGPAPVAHALLAEAGGEAVGFCLYFYNFSTFLGRPGIYIEDLFVREGFRGRGIGTLFFREVFAVAAGKNCGRVEWSVLDWNRPAIDFYDSMQAKPVSGWTVYRMGSDQFMAQAQSCGGKEKTA